jgi:hypothetical protein
MTERPMIDAILLGGSKLGARLFRQNTGMGWAGKIMKRAHDSVTLGNPRPLKAGLCMGSSDIIGIMPVQITAAMIGKTIGVFVAIEVKAGKTATSDDQVKFLAMVERYGGIAVLARDEAAALAALKK